MSKPRHRLSLRVTLLTALTVALTASVIAFVGVSAADAASPDDESQSTVTREAEPAAQNEAPENAASPVISMTTGKNTGETIHLSVTGENVRVDWGDGTPAAYSASEGEAMGKTIRVYGDNITELWCYEDALTYLDVSGCASLQTLVCSENPLTSVNLQNNAALVELHCVNTQLETLDVSHNTALQTLDCQHTSLTSLNLSHNPALQTLYTTGSPLTSLDLSNNAALVSLVCDDADLTSLDVSNHTSLTRLNCINCSRLSTLNASGCTALTELWCYFDQLTSLNVSGCSSLKVLSCHHNRLSLSALGAIDTSGFEADEATGEPRFYCAPQTKVIPSSIKAGETVDLSSDYSVGGTTTVFTWYDNTGNAVVTPTASEKGVFTFGNEFAGKTLYCAMTNARLPQFKDNVATPGMDGEEVIIDLRLFTTEVSVTAGTGDTSDDPEESSLTISVEGTADFVSGAEYTDDATFAVNGEPLDSDKLHVKITDFDEQSKQQILETVAAFAKNFKVTGENTLIYNISLLDDLDNPVTVTHGKIKLRLHYPEAVGSNYRNYVFKLYHLDGDNAEEIPTTCKPDGIYAETDNFSPYVLSWNKASSTGSANTGESSVLIWVMAGLCVLSVTAAGVVIYRKRKGTAE